MGQCSCILSNGCIGSTPASCIFNSDGSATASAFGGTAPYSYHWTCGCSTPPITGIPKGPYWLYVTDDRFANIHLPAQSMDDLRSNGMFTYTVKTKPGLAIGSQIRNRASIYFDYNAPIVTKSTLNTIATTGIANTPALKAGSFTIYPNPASSTFNAVINSETAGSGTMLIADVTGKTMSVKTIELVKGSQTITADASQFAPGIYFVSLNHNGKTETQKLVVIK